MSDLVHYADGALPKRGDLIWYADQGNANRRVNPEARELWKVMAVYSDMVKAKCVDHPNWSQAFYTAQMVVAPVVS